MAGGNVGQGTPVFRLTGLPGDRGIDLVVFDTRLLVDEFEEAIELIGAEVLPRLRRVASPV